MAEPLESAARAAYEASWMDVEPPLPWSAINDEDRARCFAVARAVIGAVSEALDFDVLELVGRVGGAVVGNSLQRLAQTRDFGRQLLDLRSGLASAFVTAF